MYQFAVIVRMSNDTLDVYPAGATLPVGSAVVALVDLHLGEWTGAVPYPYGASDIDALARNCAHWGGNDLCESVRGRAFLRGRSHE